VELAAGGGAIAAGGGVGEPAAAFAAVGDPLVDCPVDGAGGVALGGPDAPGPVFAHGCCDGHGSAPFGSCRRDGWWAALTPGSPCCSCLLPSALVEGAPHAAATAVEDVRVDHGGGHVAVT